MTTTAADGVDAAFGRRSSHFQRQNYFQAIFSFFESKNITAGPTNFARRSKTNTNRGVVVGRAKLTTTVLLDLR